MITPETEMQIARASDILEQVNRLNEMVDFHKNESKERSMMRQYELMRQEFLKELEEILTHFRINANIVEKAA